MALSDFPYSFAPQPILDPTTNTLALNALGGKVLDPATGAPLPMADLNGNPIDQISGSPFGTSQWFRSTQIGVLVMFGQIPVQGVAVELFGLAQSINSLAASAAAASTSAQQAQTNSAASAAAAQAAAASAGVGGTGTVDWLSGSILNRPDTFPPSSHTHPSGQITDASTVGKTLLTAADGQSARAAIGAGTGNGTSNLGLGTSSTTAAPGNHTHAAGTIGYTPAGSITATDVQNAIQQAAQTGGGSGTSAVYVWRYSAGAWPALPTTKPAGVLEVRALGPAYPTTIPTWVGLASGQVPMSYSKVSVA